ncbi:MAG: hypothetical protein ACFFFH_15655 [Candidatus Thorarchaeota archaeon]
MSEDLILEVARNRPGVTNQGIVRIDPTLMKKFKIEHESFVELEVDKKSTRITGAIAWPAHGIDRNKQLIRMNSITRENLGARIGDLISVRSIERIPAKKINIAPAYDFRFLRDTSELFREKLSFFPLCQGDGVSLKGLIQQVYFFMEHIPLKIRKAEIKINVISTKPEGIVTVDTETEITVLRFPHIDFISEPPFSYDIILGSKRVKLNISSFR